ESTCRCLENRFSNVVLISSVQTLDVEIESALLHEGFEKFLNQFGLKIPDTSAFEIDLVHKVRTSGKVDHHTCERLVQRNVRMREPCNATAVAACFKKRLAQNPTHIFHGMVAVDFEIALRVDFDIEMPMTGQLS